MSFQLLRGGIWAKGFLSTSLFASILKLVLNVSILSLKNLLNRLANSKLVS